MHINGIVIVGKIDTGVDVNIITPESWHPNWPLQEADAQLLGIGTYLKLNKALDVLTALVQKVGEES